MSTLEDYRKHYRFEVLPKEKKRENNRPMDEGEGRCRELLAQAPFAAVRNHYKAVLKQMSASPDSRRERARWALAETLGADIIRLPIVIEDSGRARWRIQSEGLWMGGVERAVWYVHGLLRARIESLYIGEWPSFAVTKYREARKWFPRDNLVVVSRNRALFAETKIVPTAPPRVSPLLLACFSDGVHLLLAAWGLEHEMPDKKKDWAQATEDIKFWSQIGRRPIDRP